MKMIFRRVLCLILVLATLTPVAASAATPSHSYSPVTIWGDDGTTNEMAYVDLFFNDDSSLSDKGEALEKWLNPELPANGDRTGSGYLMLEQEMDHQDSLRYMVSDAYIKINRAAMETVGSMGKNVVTAVVSDKQFKERFPNAGESAHIYYNYLYQLFLEYISSMQSSIQEVDNTLDTVVHKIGDVSSFLINGRKRQLVTYTFTNNSFALIPSNYSGNVKSFDIKNIDKGTKWVNGVETHPTLYQLTDNRILTFQELMEVGEGDAVVFRLRKKNSLKYNRISDILAKDLEELGEITKVDPKNWEMSYVAACSDCAIATEEFKHLSRDEQSAFLKSNTANKKVTKLDSPPEVEDYDTADRISDATGKIADAIGMATAIQSYVQSNKNTTARQWSYVNAITENAQTYLEMLYSWNSAIQRSTDLKPKVKEDIQDAVMAMALDIVTVLRESEDAVADLVRRSASSFTGAQFTSMILDIADSTLGLTGQDGVGQALVRDVLGKKAAASVATISAACSVGSMFLNAVTARFMDFQESSNAISNMKKSLYELIAGPGGLLTQYRYNRNHETACKIIEALNTMKGAKIMGENLVLEYYLYSYLKDIDVPTSGGLNMVMWSELMKFDGTDYIAPAEKCVPVYAVYRTNRLNILDRSVEVLGYYLQDPKDRGVTYMGKELTTLPIQYQYRTEYTYDTSDFLGDREQVVNETWLSDKEVYNTAEEMSVDDNRYNFCVTKMMLYPNNGVEVVISEEEHDRCWSIQSELNRLVKKYDNDSEHKIAFYKWNEKKEQQAAYRIEWTIITKKNIENMKMYDPSVDYWTMGLGQSR